MLRKRRIHSAPLVAIFKAFTPSRDVVTPRKHKGEPFSAIARSASFGSPYRDIAEARHREIARDVRDESEDMLPTRTSTLRLVLIAFADCFTTVFGDSASPETGTLDARSRIRASLHRRRAAVTKLHIAHRVGLICWSSAKLLPIHMRAAGRLKRRMRAACQCCRANKSSRGPLPRISNRSTIVSRTCIRRRTFAKRGQRSKPCLVCAIGTRLVSAITGRERAVIAAIETEGHS